MTLGETIVGVSTGLVIGLLVCKGIDEKESSCDKHLYDRSYDSGYEDGLHDAIFDYLMLRHRASYNELAREIGEGYNAICDNLDAYRVVKESDREKWR